MSVDLAFEVERVPFVGEVSRDEEEDEGDPKEEGVYGQKGAVVHHDPGPAESGGEYPHAGGEGGDNEFGAVADADDVRVRPDVEPDEEADDK